MTVGITEMDLFQRLQRALRKRGMFCAADGAKLAAAIAEDLDHRGGSRPTWR
jgi:hypothetical protein